MPIVMLRPKAIWTRLGCSRSGGYDKIKKGLLPPLIPLGPKSSALTEDEVEAINAARRAGKSDDEIRRLVRQLIAARKGVA